MVAVAITMQTLILHSNVVAETSKTFKLQPQFRSNLVHLYKSLDCAYDFFNMQMKLFVLLHWQGESWSLKRISEFGYLRAHATKNDLNLEVSIYILIFQPQSPFHFLSKIHQRIMISLFYLKYILSIIYFFAVCDIRYKRS